MMLQPQKEVNQLIRDKNSKLLAKKLFNFDLTPTQEKIVNEILFSNLQKFSISAMTRYGKTQLIAIAMGIYLIFAVNKKVFFIAPTREQAQILRNYLNDLVLSCPLLLELSDLELQTSQDRLKKEVSKGRVTFKNGNEYRVFTAHLDGSGLMGFGLGQGGFLVIDEACKISRDAYAKITRMLGDNPENSKIVELYNPWDRDNRAYEHSISGDWRKYEIGYKIAIKEGRTTKHFIEQQRKELTPLEFEVLYYSRFPETSEDSIFNYGKVRIAIDREIPEWVEVFNGN